MVQTDAAGLDELSAAILQELALAPRNSAMSLPRLGKQLGVGVSVLMRRLSAMGQARIGGVDGPDWVRVTQSGHRWTAALTEAGRAFWLEHVAPRAMCDGTCDAPG